MKFKGRNILTKTQKLGGLLWETTGHKSVFEAESAAAKAKIAEEAAKTESSGEE